MGIPYTPYANDPSSPPVTCDRVDLTLDEHGRRFSTFDAFLPAETASRRRGNLFICTGAVVSKLDLEKTSSGLKAVGVYFQRDLDAPGGSSPLDTVFHVSVKREVVLCAGAIVSPQILLLRCVCPRCSVTCSDRYVQRNRSLKPPGFYRCATTERSTGRRLSPCQ